LFKNKTVLITGGTGSLGNALTQRLLETDVETIRIFSRDEWKQKQMSDKFNDNRLRFFIGDVRDEKRIHRALENVDILIHAAALKQVPIIEYNPFEAIKTNVTGSQNIIEACLDHNVSTVLAVGTDKAVSPFNTYGATKLLMERLFISANYYRGVRDSNFLCVRYGNVLGSRGSIVPIILDQIKNKKNITITDPAMTRFSITMTDAVDLIFRALTNGKGGEIFVPKLKAYNVKDIVESIIELSDSTASIDIIGVRPGEKFHEVLINKDEIRNTYDSQKDYVIFETQSERYEMQKSDLVSSNLKNEYSSDGIQLLTKQEIKNSLIEENLIP